MSRQKNVQLKVWSVGNNRVWRLISIQEKQSLATLHELLRKEFKLPQNHLYAFYLGPVPFNSRQACGGPGTDTPKKADLMKLRDIGIRRGDCFTYVYDFKADDHLVLQVQRRTKATERGQQAQVLKRNGNVKSPVQAAPAADPVPQTAAAFKALLPDLKTAVDAWSDQKHPAKSVLKKHVDLIKKLEAKLDRDWEKLRHIERHLDRDVSGFLVALPDMLESEGLSEDALSVIDGFMDMEPASFSSDKPRILLSLNRQDEAERIVHENTEKFPDDPWIWAKGADVMWRLEKKQDAESYYRTALDKAPKARYIRDAVLERLLALLEETGKHRAAEELAAIEEKRRNKNA